MTKVGKDKGVKAYGKRNVQLHTFLTSVLNGSGQIQALADLPQAKKPQCAKRR